MMGLGILEEFEASAVARTVGFTNALKQASAALVDAERRRADTAARLEAIKLRLATTPMIDSAQSSVAELLSDAKSPFLPLRIPSSASEASELIAEVRRLRAEIEALSKRRALTNTQLVTNVDVDIAQLRVREREAKAALDSAEAAYTAAAHAEQVARDHADQISRLAALVIPMLGDHCPVCGQAIHSDDVRLGLEARAADLASLVSAGSRTAEADQRRIAARLLLTTVSEAVVTATAAQSRREVAERARSAEDSEFAALLKRQRFLPRDLETLWDSVPTLVDALDTLGRVLSTLAIALSAVDREGEIARLEAELKASDETLGGQRRRTEDLGRRESEARSFAETAREARLDVVSQQFEALEPVVVDIYERLDPHPTFTSIVFEHEVYRSRGTSAPMVRDEVTRTMARPQLIFSSSQANVVALAYFLATALTLGQSWLPFLMLDDPLQSLDDVNVLGFADLCRLMRARRQLIVSTHDKRLARLLERKFAPRAAGEATLVLEFVAWSRSGPEIERRFVEPQLEEAKPKLAAS
jgi:DNA repair exonuclease SbcCD ATPase subunit